jgi:voltage-gated potassium channel Kch
MAEKQSELKGIGYEIFIGALSILSIANLLMMFFVQEPALEQVLLVINAIMFPIFLGDFFYRLVTAESRSGYFFRGAGWADLLSSLPFPQVKIFRVFRVWRVIRLFIRFGARNLVHEFIANRAANALLTVGFLVLCVLEFGSLAVLRAEIVSPDANITSAGDALWWAFVTITTVGYGDRFPVTNWGRLIGVLVMVAGVGLFGTLSGFLANSFLSPSKPKQGAVPDPATDTPAARLAALKRMIEAQEKNTAELKTQLEELEKIL